MTERHDLLGLVANTINGYRVGEIATPTPDHVERWVSQFSQTVQIPLLRELSHVLNHTYLSKSMLDTFLSGLVKNEKLTGENSRAFWSSTNFLDVQNHGHSQDEMLSLFDATLRRECGLKLQDCGAKGGHFVYLDDVMFSGNRVGNDLAKWIVEDAHPARRSTLLRQQFIQVANTL